MSRIGKMPVTIPAGVKIQVNETEFVVSGPKGELVQPYQMVSFSEDAGIMTVSPIGESKAAHAFQGLYRQLLSNMIEGVSKGFSKSLIINGVGYRAEVKGNILFLNLGLSTQVEFMIPEDISIACESPTKVIVSGINKQRVGQIAADIRSLRKPEPYKGKGIRYEDEVIRRKVGKSGVK